MKARPAYAEVLEALRQLVACVEQEYEVDPEDFRLVTTLALAKKAIARATGQAVAS